MSRYIVVVNGKLYLVAKRLPGTPPVYHTIAITRHLSTANDIVDRLNQSKEPTHLA